MIPVTNTGAAPVTHSWGTQIYRLEPGATILMTANEAKACVRRNPLCVTGEASEPVVVAQPRVTEPEPTVDPVADPPLIDVNTRSTPLTSKDGGRRRGKRG